MTWQPEKQVIDATTVAENILSYIETHNEDALLWANGSYLEGFRAFYSNASGRLQTIFPSLMILTQEMETDLSGDILLAGLQLTFEGTVSGSIPDELVTNTKKYAMAVESMLSNIPSDSVTTNGTATLFEIETRFDILRGQATPNAFLQIFQTRCVYRLTAGAY